MVATASADMLSAMSEAYKIRSTSEASAAQRRATRTELATVPLLKELGRPELSERERAEKKQEIDRLRRQYCREMEAVDAFYTDLVPKLKQAEWAFELGDPEIERLRQELVRILKHESENKRSEIARVQREFDRRLNELARK